MTNSIKYTVLFLLITITTFGQHNGPINWLTLEQADSLYKIQKKPVFIDVYTDWCGWCKRMDASTFKDPNVANYLNQHYYAVKLNAETRDTIVFNGKTYTNSQSVKVAEMLKDMNAELKLYSDSLANKNVSEEDKARIKKLIPRKKSTLSQFKRRARKTTHDVAIDLCQGKMSYPTFIILFNDLKSNMPLKGFQKVPDLIGHLAFINEGVYRSTRNAAGFNALFKQSILPDSLRKPELINWVTFEDAIIQSKKDNKKIFIHIVNPSSIASNIMDKISYREESTAKVINDNFHAVKFNIFEKRSIQHNGNEYKNIEGVHQLAMVLMQNKPAFPSMSFLDSKGDLIMRVPQFFEPKLVDPVLQYFIEEGYKKGTFGEWKTAKEKQK